eukprot:3606195-Pleurochrysis_carterae.AAC.1
MRRTILTMQKLQLPARQQVRGVHTDASARAHRAQVAVHRVGRVEEVSTQADGLEERAQVHRARLARTRTSRRAEQSVAKRPRHAQPHTRWLDTCHNSTGRFESRR